MQIICHQLSTRDGATPDLTTEEIILVEIIFRLAHNWMAVKTEL